jgi:hypothetical protein
VRASLMGDLVEMDGEREIDSEIWELREIEGD